MILFDKSVFNILKDAPNNSTIKTFLFIALNQPQEGLHGLIITKPELAFIVDSGKSSIFRDLKWLKDNMLIQELKFPDNSDYMANPRFVMNNSDFEARNAEWIRRCHLDIQHEIELNRRRRRKREKLQKN